MRLSHLVLNGPSFITRLFFRTGPARNCNWFRWGFTPHMKLSALLQHASLIRPLWWGLLASTYSATKSLCINQASHSWYLHTATWIQHLGWIEYASLKCRAQPLLVKAFHLFGISKAHHLWLTWLCRCILTVSYHFREPNWFLLCASHRLTGTILPLQAQPCLEEVLPLEFPSFHVVPLISADTQGPHI